MKSKQILEVLRIVGLKAEIAKLYEKLEVQTTDFQKAYGTGRFDFDLLAFTKTDTECSLDSYLLPSLIEAEELLKKGPYLKFEVVDNIAQLREGKVVYRSTSMKATAVSHRSLKNCPVSLKGVK